MRRQDRAGHRLRGARWRVACRQRRARLHGQRRRKRAGESGGRLVLAGDVGRRRRRDARTRARTAASCATWRATAPRPGRSRGNKIDRKAPVITVTTPANGATYPLNESVAASVCAAPTAARGRRRAPAPSPTALRSTRPRLGTEDVRRQRRGRRRQLVERDRDLRRQADAHGGRTGEGLDRAEEQRRCRDCEWICGPQVLVNGVVAATGELANVCDGQQRLQQRDPAIDRDVAAGRTRGGSAICRWCRCASRRAGPARAADATRVPCASGTTARPIDSGPQRDAGSRVAVTLGGQAVDLFQRPLFLLLPNDGHVRISVDAGVNSSAPCPARPYVPFGVWSIVAP